MITKEKDISQFNVLVAKIPALKNSLDSELSDSRLELFYISHSPTSVSEIEAFNRENSKESRDSRNSIEGSKDFIARRNHRRLSIPAARISSAKSTGL